MTGWLFYSAHNVGIELTVDQPGNLVDSSGIVSLQGTPLWESYLTIVPVVMLFVTGLVLGWFVSGDSWIHNAKAGATLTAGYLPLVIMGTFGTKWSYTMQPAAGSHATVTVQPSLAQSIIIAGVAYPILIGGIGGAVGGGLQKNVNREW